MRVVFGFNVQLGQQAHRVGIRDIQRTRIAHHGGIALGECHAAQRAVYANAAHQMRHFL